MADSNRKCIYKFMVMFALLLGTVSVFILLSSNQSIQAGTYTNSPNLHNEKESRLFSLTGWGIATEGSFYCFSQHLSKVYWQGTYRQLKEDCLVLLTADIECCGYVVRQDRNSITVLWYDGTYDEFYKFDKYAVRP